MEFHIQPVLLKTGLSRSFQTTSGRPIPSRAPSSPPGRISVAALDVWQAATETPSLHLMCVSGPAPWIVLSLGGSLVRSGPAARLAPKKTERMHAPQAPQAPRPPSWVTRNASWRTSRGWPAPPDPHRCPPTPLAFDPCLRLRSPPSTTALHWPSRGEPSWRKFLMLGCEVLELEKFTDQMNTTEITPDIHHLTIVMCCFDTVTTEYQKSGQYLPLEWFYILNNTSIEIEQTKFLLDQRTVASCPVFSAQRQFSITD